VSEQPLPKDVQRFISDHISSVVVLEALLLLFAHPGRDWSATELGAELRVDAGWTERELGELARRGVIRRREGASAAAAGDAARYEYPEDAPTRATLAALAECYQERRVSVISMIFAKPAEAIQTFADAFNLRKDRHGR
jgi:hypothetical protein